MRANVGFQLYAKPTAVLALMITADSRWRAGDIFRAAVKEAHMTTAGGIWQSSMPK